MGCTIHCINVGILTNNILFFKEVSRPHTSIKVRNHFEDQLDHCHVQTFRVVSDNAANMKCAFTMEIDPVLNSDESVCIDDYESNSESIVQSQPRRRTFHDGVLG